MRREKERKMRGIKKKKGREQGEKGEAERVDWRGKERKQGDRRERWRELMRERRDVKNERYGGREQGEGESGRDIGRGEWPRNGSQLSESLKCVCAWAAKCLRSSPDQHYCKQKRDKKKQSASAPHPQRPALQEIVRITNKKKKKLISLWPPIFQSLWARPARNPS